MLRANEYFLELIFKQINIRLKKLFHDMLNNREVNDNTLTKITKILTKIKEIKNISFFPTYRTLQKKLCQ